MGSARVARTASVCGRVSASTTKTSLAEAEERRRSVIASAAAVGSSSRLAPEIGNPVRSQTMVWKFSSASSLPCEISG